MPLSNDAKNAMLDHLASIAKFASLHSADPGDNGANELSGGSPAYERRPVRWAPATSSRVSLAPPAGIAKGAAIRSATGAGGTHTGGGTVGTDTISRTVRTLGIGVESGDTYTLAVRGQVQDNS